jgi:hypothetical protein
MELEQQPVDKMAEAKAIGQIIMECVDEQLLLKRVMEEVILPKLDKIVAESPNKIDDAVLAMVKEVLAKVK